MDKGLMTVGNEPWYTQLVDDCKDIFTETEFTARWTIIEGYHHAGKRILEDGENFTRAGYTIDGMLQRVATSLGKSERTIRYVIQFARKYPDLNLLPAGKNVSWHAICNKYLPEPREEIEPAEPRIDWGEVTMVGARLVTDAGIRHIKFDTVVDVLKLCASSYNECEDCPDMQVCRQAYDRICDSIDEE